jgi:hypothetical protein
MGDSLQAHRPYNSISNLRDTNTISIPALAAATIAGCAISYGCYKLYTHISFSNACTRLEQNKIQSTSIAASAYPTAGLSEQQIVEKYSHNLEGYRHLCRNVHQDMRTLADIQTTTDQDISAWMHHDAQFCKNARAFSAINQEHLYKVSARVTFFDKHINLIQLVHLLDEEATTPTYPLMYAARFHKLTESTVRTYSSQSLWPLLDAWKKLEQRKQLYQQCVNALSSQVNHSKYLCAKIQDGQNYIDAYAQAQCVIAGFDSYTQDLRTEKEFALKEEQARQARIQAEAAQRIAEEQARQARAQEQQIRHNKEHELACLRNELSALKQRICNGENSYYIHQQKYGLQNRIRQLKSELYGSSSLSGFLFECLTDQD